MLPPHVLHLWSGVPQVSVLFLVYMLLQGQSHPQQNTTETIFAMQITNKSIFLFRIILQLLDLVIKL